jgi:hypothetical protein
MSSGGAAFRQHFLQKQQLYRAKLQKHRNKQSGGGGYRSGKVEASNLTDAQSFTSQIGAVVVRTKAATVDKVVQGDIVTGVVFSNGHAKEDSDALVRLDPHMSQHVRQELRAMIKMTRMLSRTNVSAANEECNMGRHTTVHALLTQCFKISTRICWGNKKEGGSSFYIITSRKNLCENGVVRHCICFYAVSDPQDGSKPDCLGRVQFLDLNGNDITLSLGGWFAGEKGAVHLSEIESDTITIINRSPITSEQPPFAEPLPPTYTELEHEHSQALAEKLPEEEQTQLKELVEAMHQDPSLEKALTQELVAENNGQPLLSDIPLPLNGSNEPLNGLESRYQHVNPQAETSDVLADPNHLIDEPALLTAEVQMNPSEDAHKAVLIVPPGDEHHPTAEDAVRQMTGGKYGYGEMKRLAAIRNGRRRGY